MDLDVTVGESDFPCLRGMRFHLATQKTPVLFAVLENHENGMKAALFTDFICILLSFFSSPLPSWDIFSRSLYIFTFRGILCLSFFPFSFWVLLFSLIVWRFIWFRCLLLQLLQLFDYDYFRSRQVSFFHSLLDYFNFLWYEFNKWWSINCLPSSAEQLHVFKMDWLQSQEAASDGTVDDDHLELDMNQWCMVSSLLARLAWTIIIEQSRPLGNSSLLCIRIRCMYSTNVAFYDFKCKTKIILANKHGDSILNLT